MKNSTEERRFLENFYKYLANRKIINHEWRDYYGRKEMVDKFYKSLALGKQEPLAKNKRAENKTILHECSCEKPDPIEINICLECDGITH